MIPIKINSDSSAIGRSTTARMYKFSTDALSRICLSSKLSQCCSRRHPICGSDQTERDIQGEVQQPVEEVGINRLTDILASDKTAELEEVGQKEQTQQERICIGGTEGANRGQTREEVTVRAEA
eukprot:768717-Hanusia_phi.AAC.5